MRLLFTNSVPLGMINAWSTSMPSHKAAFAHLTKLKLCVKAPIPVYVFIFKCYLFPFLRGAPEGSTYLQLNEKLVGGSLPLQTSKST